MKGKVHYLPTLGRTLPVLNGWSGELLKIAPCRYLGSAYNDNLIVMAHNYDSHFGRLKKLQIGDPVTFRDVERTMILNTKWFPWKS